MLIFRYLILCVYVLLGLSCSVGKCSKVLAIFPSSGYSQYILAEKLLIALAGRGHNVTIISGFETKNVKNLTNIVINLSSEKVKEPDSLLKRQDLSTLMNNIILSNIVLEFSEKILADKQVQRLINSEEKFDLVLIETFLSESLQAFSKHFDAHQVLFTSMALNEWNSHMVANPNLPSFIPNRHIGYTSHMNFAERFQNTLAFGAENFYKYYVHVPTHQKLVDKYFPKKYNLDDIIYNVSLMLTCSHVSASEPLPLTMAVVEVGGLHIENKRLPDDVQDFLDSAEDGAIFFSLGSNFKSSTLSKKLIQEILSVIGKLKQKVLWKFEDDKLEKKPDNLIISKWFPQNDILAHPNTKIFITHCGMGSTTEAIYHGVPVIAIPIFGDQFMNARRLVQFGIALQLSLKSLSGETLETGVNEMLRNKSYTENAKKRSKIMHDRPLEPLDLAVYSIEYVLRHDGAHHLKNSILYLSWYQLYLLDVVAALTVIICVIIYLMLIANRCFRNRFGYKQKPE